MKAGDIKVDKFEKYFGKRNNKNLLDEGGVGAFKQTKQHKQRFRGEKWWVYMGFRETTTA